MKMVSIQYLRGLAAMLVLLTHALAYPLPGRDAELRRFASLGVILFFVISGFIMTYISGPGRFDARGFLRRRAIRVVPLYWIATLALAALMLVAPGVLRNGTFDGGRLVLSLLFVPHYNPAGETAPLLKLGWTLNYEMFFYVCFAAFAFLDARRRVIALAALFGILIAIGLAAGGFTTAILYYYTQKDLLAFCLGMAIGLAALDGRTGGGSAIAAALAAALFVAGTLVHQGGPIDWPVYLCQMLASGALLWAALGAERWMPHWRVPTLIGDASYSLYLVHMYFVAGAVIVLRKLIPGAPIPLLVVAGMAGGVAGGLAVHRFVEQPLLRWMQAPRLRVGRARARAGAPPIDGANPALLPDAPGDAH